MDPSTLAAEALWRPASDPAAYAALLWLLFGPESRLFASE